MALLWGCSPFACRTYTIVSAAAAVIALQLLISPAHPRFHSECPMIATMNASEPCSPSVPQLMPNDCHNECIGALLTLNATVNAQ